MLLLAFAFCLFAATFVSLLDNGKAVQTGTCWFITACCFVSPCDTAHSRWCLAQSIHTKILMASFPPRQQEAISFLAEKCGFGGPVSE